MQRMYKNKNKQKLLSFITSSYDRLHPLSFSDGLCETGTPTEEMLVAVVPGVLMNHSGSVHVVVGEGVPDRQEAHYTPAALKRDQRPPVERGT